MGQLEMFDNHFKKVDEEKAVLRKDKRRIERIQFWKDKAGWEATVGEKARIDSTISFCETENKNGYTYCMRVKILSITDYVARVETTEEWQQACQSKAFPNKQGLIWSVPVEDLAPWF